MKKRVSLLVIIPLLVSAKITQKELREGEYEIVIVQKGDTLWDLAGKYIGKCYQWPEFKEYNWFTDPHWIYPGEKLAIGIKDGRLVIRKAEELEREFKLKLKEKDEEIIRLKEELERLKEAPKIVPEEESRLERERKLEGERKRLEAELNGLKGEADFLRKGMDELAKRLSETEERLSTREDMLLREKQEKERTQEELRETQEEKERVVKEEKTQRRYKEILAISAFVGIIIVNSLK